MADPLIDFHAAPVLAGSHVRLEPLTSEHAAALLAAADDDAVFAHLTFLRPRTLADAEAMVDRYLAGPQVPWVQVEVATGEVGTLYFEREEFEGAPFEYHNDPAKTASTQHPDHPNWTTVGDLGYLDAEGYLYLTDRKAFMIISGGVNIYPQEVEDLFSLHPAVLDIAVLGVPDDEMGERVVAFVQPAVPVVDGPAADLARELTAYARERIAHYKVPKEIHFRDELPRTPTGKMVKGKLKAEYVAS